MKIPKPSPEDMEYFRSLFADRPEVEVKPMFGNVAAFVVPNAQMCAGLFGPALGVRLSEEDRATLLAEPGTAPFGPEERPMKEYVSLPLAWRSDASRTDAWLDRAIAHTAALAAKKKRAKKQA